MEYAYNVLLLNNELQSDKSTTDTKAQKLPVSPQDTASSDDTKEEESDHHTSSESSDSSDSEGVVAVVPKTRNSKVRTMTISLWECVFQV